jgi:hypothetical protein
MKKRIAIILLCLPAILNGSAVLSLDVSTMQTDTSDGVLPAYNGSFGKIIPLNTEVPVLTADDSYSGPDLYGGVSRNIFKGAGGVANAGSSGWRARVNATVPFDEATANTGAIELSILHVFRTGVNGVPTVVQFTEGNDLLDASNIFTSDMARVASATISFVIRDGGMWYISESSSNLQTGGLEGNTSSLYSANALSVTWYAYDPLTDVSTAATKGEVATPVLASIDFVGFLLETTSIEEQGGYNYGVRIFTAEGVPSDARSSWAGYEILTDGWVDTTPWLGWIKVSQGDYVWSIALGKYIYLPEAFVGESGAWSYVPGS